MKLNWNRRRHGYRRYGSTLAYGAGYGGVIHWGRGFGGVGLIGW